MSTTELTVESGMHIHPEEPGGPIASPPKTEEPKESERQRSPREEAMSRIAEHRAEALAREIAYGRELGMGRDEPGEPPPREEAGDPNEPPISAAQPLQQQHQQPVQPEQAQQQPAQQQPELIPFDPGNGQIIYVTPDQLAQLARDGAAYRIAAQNQLAQRQQQQQMPAQPTHLLPPDRTEAIVKRLTFGDPREATAALDDYAKEILGRVAQFQAPPEQIAAVATQRAIETIRMEQNLNAIGNEYPDIFADRILSQVAALKVGELRQQYAMHGRQVSDLELYRGACSAVRASARTQTPQQPASDPVPAEPARNPASQAASVASASFAPKLERKRAAPSQPAAVGRAASDDAAKPWEGDRARVVDQIRRARGQPSMR